MVAKIVCLDISLKITLSVFAFTTPWLVNCRATSATYQVAFSSPSEENDGTLQTAPPAEMRHDQDRLQGVKILRVPMLEDIRPIFGPKTSMQNAASIRPIYASLKHGKRKGRKKKPSSKEVRDARTPERRSRRKKKKKRKHTHRYSRHDWSSHNLPPVHTHHEDFPGYDPRNHGGIPAFVPLGPFRPYYPDVHGYYPTYHHHPSDTPPTTPSRTTRFPSSTISPPPEKPNSGSTRFPPVSELPMASTPQTTLHNPTNTTPSSITITKLTSTPSPVSTPTTPIASTTDADAEFIPPYLYDRTGEVPSWINCTFSQWRK